MIGKQQFHPKYQYKIVYKRNKDATNFRVKLPSSKHLTCVNKIIRFYHNNALYCGVVTLNLNLTTETYLK